MWVSGERRSLASGLLSAQWQLTRRNVMHGTDLPDERGFAGEKAAVLLSIARCRGRVPSRHPLG